MINLHKEENNFLRSKVFYKIFRYTWEMISKKTFKENFVYRKKNLIFKIFENDLIQVWNILL